jgi:hypothetical protein
VAIPLMHKNMVLARALIEQFIAETHMMVDGNQHLFALLDGGDEYDVVPLPGNTLHDIVDNMQTLLKLAIEPASKPAGRGNVGDAMTRQRDKIAMLVRTVLALLASDKGVTQ